LRLANKNIIAKDIFEELFYNKVLLTYFGALDFGVTNQMIKHLSGSLLKDNLNKKQFNKVYSAFAEGVENAFRHQKVLKENTPGIIICSKNGSSFHTYIGNTIYAEDRVSLIRKFDEYASYPIEKLKALAKSSIAEADEANQRSPQIGLLRIFISADKQVAYSFKELENGELLFVLNFSVNID
jgi:hypothetical protein